MSEHLKIIYRNWRGEITERTIKPLGALTFGSTPYHREPQWLLPAMDIDKGQERTFAVKDILSFDPAVFSGQIQAAQTRAAVEEEREECAKIAMSYRTPDDGDYACGKDVVARDIAEEIRGRK